MKQILYTGLKVPNQYQNETASRVIHCPLIKIVPKAWDDPFIQEALHKLPSYTHLIFTSQNGVSIFFDYAQKQNISLKEIAKKQCIAVGKKTADQLRSYGITRLLTAIEETAEGVITLLEQLDLKNAYLFWPHSARSRNLLLTWMQKRHLPHCACPFYDTITHKPTLLPDLSLYDEIIFTSPSTIDAFIEVFGRIPQGKQLTCIGPITQSRLETEVL